MIGKGVRNRILALAQIEIDREIARIIEDAKTRLDDPLIAYGHKVYSQCDEDGIIAEIFRRIGRTSSVFIEIGCGNGIENNTHALLLQSWKGVWIDGNRKNISGIQNSLGNSYRSRLVLKEALVTPENINDVLDGCLVDLLEDQNQRVDFFSIDVDSYDLAILRQMELRPRVICAEYNAKYPPPIEVEVPYAPDQGWCGDDYMGASLASICRQMTTHGYRLVACNVSGVNAFFVEEDLAGHFEEASIEALYMPPRYQLCLRNSGHPPSLKFLCDQFKQT